MCIAFDLLLSARLAKRFTRSGSVRNDMGDLWDVMWQPLRKGLADEPFQYELVLSLA